MRPPPFLRLLISLCLLGSAAASTDPKPGQICFQACQFIFEHVKFAGHPSANDDADAANCGNRLHAESMFLCARQYCSQAEILDGYSFQKNACEADGFELLSLNIVDNFTAQDINNLPILQQGRRPRLVNSSIIPSQSYFDVAFKTEDQWYRARSNHLWYSKALFIFWGIVFFFGICANAVSHIRAHAYRHNITPLECSEQSPSSHRSLARRAWTQVRARLLLPATFGHHCDTPIFQCKIPPRIETIVIAASLVLNIILCAVSYEAFYGSLLYPTKGQQLWRYVADRTGYLSYANLGIFWLFGTRNNILLWLTGWNFSTFNRFHRWTARMSTLQAVLHSIGYTVFAFGNGGLKHFQDQLSQQFWYAGTISTVAMCFMIGFSILWLRVKAYDLFLIIHVSLAIVTLVTLFYHTHRFDGDYDGFLWPCVAFWVFDRACRILRVIYGVARAGLKNATVEYFPDAHLIRINVTDIMASRKPHGGHNYFVYHPFSWRGWESHPFTLVRWKEDIYQRSSSTESSLEDGKEGVASASVSNVISDSPSQYSFLIRPMKGFTSRLSQAMSGKDGGQATKLLFEGPYGHRPALDRYTNILLIIGGSGISVGISNIYDILERNPTARVHLVWSCRNKGLVDSILAKELKAAANSASVTVDAYVTRDGDVSTDKPSVPCRKIDSHRPDVESTIQNAVDSRQGPLAVLTCGPPTLTDDVRAAVVGHVADGQDVSLVVQAFNW